MPHEPVDKGSPQEWLVYARSDLGIARRGKSPDVLLETLCFHAQQAVEKAIKALLIRFGIPTIKSHNIGALLNLLPDSLSIAPEIQEAAILTDYAVVTRYPGDVEPVTEQEYQQALNLAELVMKWAETQIRNKA